MATTERFQLGKIDLMTRSSQGETAVADFLEQELTPAEEMLYDAYRSDNFASYDIRKHESKQTAGRVAKRPLTPYRASLPEGQDPFVYIEEIGALAKSIFFAKPEIVVMEVATSSDPAAESINTRLRQFGRSFVNPLLITLDLLKMDDIEDGQLARCDEIRETISGLVMPSLVITAPELTKPR